MASTLPTGKVQFTGTMSTHLRDEPVTIIGTMTEVPPPETAPPTETPPADPAKPAPAKK